MNNILRALALPFFALVLFVVPGEARAWNTSYTQAPTVFSNLYGSTQGGNWCGSYMCPRNVYVDYYPMLKDGTSNTSLIPGSVITVDASFQVTKFEIYPGQTNYFFGNCTNANAAGNLYYFYTNSSYYRNPPGLYCVETPGFDPGAWGNPYGSLGTYGWTQTVYNPNGYKSAYPAYSDVVITPTPTITSSDPSIIACSGTSCTSQSVGTATLTVTYPSTYAEEYNAWCWGGPGCGYVFSLTSPTGSYYYGPHAVVPATSVPISVTVSTAANPPPSISFLNANPNPVSVGSSTKLFWFTSGTGTITCNASAVPIDTLWSGSKPTSSFSGFDTSILTTDTTFTISCSSEWGNGTKSRVVTIIPSATSCVPPWGGSIASGDSVVSYQSAAVMSPLSCVSETRTCTNGTLSGTYTNQACSVIPAACTLPWGGSIASGNSTIAYQTSSVTSPATCTSQSRLCTNGTLAGTYTNQNCVENSAAACPNTVCESSAGETPLTCPQDCKVKYRTF